MTDQDFMQAAIAQARAGMAVGQSPFGACIVRGGVIIAATHNQVRASTDSTAHAEIVCIRAACRELGTIDLSGCSIYSTTEPCPMCFAAIHWARLDRIIFGAQIADAAHAGFNELAISNEQMKKLGPSRVTITAGVLAEDCAALFAEYKDRGGKTY